MADYAKELQAELLGKSMGIQGTTAEQLKQGPAELEKLIASMDKQIDLKKQSHDKLLDSINSDIESALKKVTLHKKYVLVLKDVKANISGVDVTDDVCTEIKNIAN
jgi:Outer membrane protein (OmpH-like).